MWVFYLISLPLTLGMVLFTLKYFAGPEVPRYVMITVGYTWFCSLSIIVIVPADIWTTINHIESGGISFFWSWSYWSTFLLTWTLVPLIQGFEDAGDFTVTERLKTSVHVNLVFYLILGFIGLLGLILLISAFLLGFGLSEIPKGLWKNSDWTIRQKVLSHKIAKMAVKLDDAHQDLSNAIVVAQATSTQMSKRDPLRPYMDIIDNMLAQMFREDPSFKPQGGRLGENDMDYDTDEKSMATLRRHLRGAREEYYRYKSEYMTYVLEALELEDTIKNYERRSSTGWKYVSSFRHTRTGTLGSPVDTIEFLWRCILRKEVEKLLAVILGIISVAILLAEATLLPRVDLSLFSILINSVGKQEVLVQVFAFVPLLYMCICTYYSLFKIGMLMFYSLTPRQTNSVNLLMICSMVARYAPPVSYNFLNLIRLGEHKTIFEKRMGNIDQAVPFFGSEFNRIYPLIMVVYTLLVACNFFDRILDFFGSWKRFRFQTEADDMDGFDPSGLIILQKERSWIEQGLKVGEHVIPLARNFNSTDVETGSNNMDRTHVELKATTSLGTEGANGTASKSLSDESRIRYGSSKEANSNKYAAIRDQSRQSSSNTNQNISAAKVSLRDEGNSNPDSMAGGLHTGLSSKWESMKNGFQNFKANIAAKKFIPLHQVQDTVELSRASSNESLDEIFQRLKRRSVDHVSYVDEDEDGMEGKSGPSR
ncbi:LMBR1 domain-containing protein 2 homolog A-like isoform X2 [Pyrus x bretschneideri]|uniref:LMBR1 domain-containing protein 2 homolog A-like isoform X2 n=1 Tax=Pyrus x bretschneideri TaxID=225117 RepID=UPI0020305CD7|nr:LMBR1 domain-containing protein 2 homolog A-like isoform X2 [Pyrus x bretschneideri]